MTEKLSNAVIELAALFTEDLSLALGWVSCLTFKLDNHSPPTYDSFLASYTVLDQRALGLT